MNSTKEIIKIKRQFLILFFQQVKNIEYGVIDIEDNLDKEINNDIDVWVYYKDLKEFVKTLYKFAKENEWIIKKMNISPRIGHSKEGKYALLYKKKPFCVIQIDIWEKFHWRSVPFIKNDLREYIINGKNKYYKKIKNNVAIYIQILKDILYKGYISEKVKKRILMINKIDSLEIYYLLNNYYSKKLIKKLLKVLENKNFDINNIKSNEYKKSLIINSIKKNFINFFKFFIIYFFRTIYIKLLQDGLLIVFIGPDGVGKTTIGNVIMKTEFANYFYEKKFYLHTRYNLIPSLNKILFFFYRKNKKLTKNNREIKPLPLKRALIYPLYYIIDYILGFFWLFEQRRNGGCFILFDRYFYEYFIQPVYKNVPHILLKYLEILIPKPDLIIFFKNNPNIIFERKKELPLPEIENQLRKYEELTNNKNNGYIINNNKDINLVVYEILKIIISYIDRMSK